MKPIFLKSNALLFIAYLMFSVNLNAQKATLTNNPSNSLKVVNNPIISNLGVCDPHIRIFNNKAYLFASHDKAPNNEFYGMYDWWVWSSSDLVHWTMEFNLFPKDMWCGATNNSWAVDGAFRNGNVYFYVSGNWRTGIAVSTNGPGGPYKDALGKQMIGQYDPTIFIDDDAKKTPYLIAGKFPYEIAKLNEDMISLAEEQKPILHDTVGWKGDGGFLHKRNGIYYLNGHGTSYSTATNIYGPYTYRGKYYKDWIDHPMVFEWNNQTFCAFGRGEVGRLFRKTHLTYVHYRENGEIYADDVVGVSLIGVGQYDCSKKIEAEWYFAATKEIGKKEIPNNGWAVTNLKNNAYLYYQRVLNAAANATIEMNVSSAVKGGIIEIREDKVNGKLLGKMNVPNTGNLSTYQTVSAKLNNKAGLLNVYLVYKGGNGKTANFDWLTISSTGAIVEPPKGKPIIVAAGPNENTVAVSAYNQIEAEDLICYHVLRTSDEKNNGEGRFISNMKNGSYSSYMIDFGPSENKPLNFQARLSSVKPGQIEIRLDSVVGKLIGTLDYDTTGTNQTAFFTKECKVNAPAGVKHVFLVYKMEKEEKYHNSAPSVNLNWIKFIK